MGKLPAKQIYLLSIIVFGIITLSVYSTYAIFTFESGTSDDIVNLHTPNSLAVFTDLYEYKRISANKNGMITTDVDIYNTFDYDICYSVWYKIASKNIDSSSVKIYQLTDNDITASGTLEKASSRRIKLLIINNNSRDVIVNIGVSSSQNDGTCELNISSDKLNITSKIDNYKILSDEIIKKDNTVEHDSGYVTYKNVDKEINISDQKVFVSDAFNYSNELFTLTNSVEMNFSDNADYNGKYVCFSSDKCRALYKINKISSITDNGTVKYKLSNYDINVGYQQGTSGIRKINDNYYYYGDNPNNYIYFNCSNLSDNSTCELWRIVSFVKAEDGKYVTKIIKNDSIELFKYSDDDNNLWDKSNISSYLENEYKINNSDFVKSYKVSQENILSLDTKVLDIKAIDSDKVFKTSIMSLTDYLNSSSCQKDKISDYDDNCFLNNWLNINYDGINEWTTSIRYENEYLDELTGEIIIPENNTVYAVGDNINVKNVNNQLKFRPVVYLKESVFLNGGNGTINNPYVIK